MSNLVELSSLNLQGSYNIVHIYLPNNITLKSNAFANLRNLETLDGKGIKLNGSGIF
nr:MAG TPA: Surface antigen, Leucine Rich Repeat (LRR).0A [Bacteriophage sp.]